MAFTRILVPIDFSNQCKVALDVSRCEKLSCTRHL